jgi:TolB-like protein
MSRSSDGLMPSRHEEITNSLTRVSGLNVIARTSAFHFKGASIDIREVGQRLGADLVIEGSVRKAGEQLRITAQAIQIDRDDDQFHQAEQRGSDVLRILQSQPTIQIRVKTGRELMHEKVVLIDDRIIRDGSGNWSVSAARYQDNEITISFDPEEIKAFQQDFAEMWARPDNQIVQ